MLKLHSSKLSYALEIISLMNKQLPDNIQTRYKLIVNNQCNLSQE